MDTRDDIRPSVIDTRPPVIDTRPEASSSGRAAEAAVALRAARRPLPVGRLRMAALGLTAAAGMALVAGCGQAPGPIPTFPPSPSPSSAPARGGCVTTAGVVECVSHVVYFTVPDQSGALVHAVSMSYSVNNRSPESVSGVGSDLQVVDSRDQAISDVRSPAYYGTGQVPVALESGGRCFDSFSSPVTVLPGHAYTLPSPLCFMLADGGDRVMAVVDEGDDQTMAVGG